MHRLATTLGKRLRGGAWTALPLAFVAFCASSSASPPLTEYEVKAGFIYNFARLVEWPATTAPGMTLCIVGADPFGSAKDSLKGKTVGGLGLDVRLAPPGSSVADCRIVFVSPTASATELGAILQQTAGHPILTIGDAEGLAARGIIINFYRQEDAVRFEINIDAAQRAGLKVSSRLLNLARVVRGTGASP